MKKLSSVLAIVMLCALSGLSLSAQTRLAKGRVLDSSSEPIIGVAVIESGTSNGTITDENGDFSLRISSGDVTVTFSALGYEGKDVLVKAGHNAPLTITLEDDTTVLEETVVVGYGVQKKVNLTGAITTVEAKNLENRSAHSLSTMLQGSVPGLNVSTSSGNPGSTGSLNIRGITSINSAGPLVLIDGVEGDINRVNPNDVASISVIKDASSAAVYGARAAFGVVLVTTKEGTSENDKATVRYSGRWGFEAPTTSTEYETRGYWSVYTVNKFWSATQGVDYVTYSHEDMRELLARVNDKTENPERPWVVEKNGHYKYYANTDWWHEMYNDIHPVQTQSISVSGGNKAVKYYLSGQYNRQQGMIKAHPDVFQKYNLRAKIDAKINKYARLSNNTNFFSSVYDYPGVDDIQDSFAMSNRHGLACFPLQNPDGTWVYIVDDLSGFRVANGRHWAFASKDLNLIRREDFSNTTELTIKPVKQLTIKANYTYRTYTNHDTHRLNTLEYSQYPGQVVDYTGGIFDNWMGESISSYRYNSTNIFATYEDTFADNHHFTAMAGGNYDGQYRKSVSATGYDLITKELSDLNLISTSNRAPVIGGGQTEWRNLGFFGRLNYDYKGRYLFETSARMDGTSRFAVGHKWGFFPSASIGWRISEEPFFTGARSVVNNLKLRASYGTLGNQKTSSNYTYLRLIGFKTFDSYNFGGATMDRYTNIGDPIADDMTWEMSKQSNLGLDLAMFGNKFEFTAEAYIRDTEGMLTDGMDLPSIYGADSPQMNAADLRTKGLEFSLSWRDSFDLAGKSFSYHVRPTLSYYTSHITKFANDTKLLSNYYEGQELGEIWGFEIDGFFASDEEAATNPVDQSYCAAKLLGGWKAGDVRYVDKDGDNKISVGKNTLSDHGDLVYLGNSLAKLHYGVTTGFSWCGFDASVFFEGTGNHYWYPSRESFAFWGPYSKGYATHIEKDFLSRCWSEENPDAYFPRPRAMSASNHEASLGRVNNRYIQNIRYLRLKNVTVGYELPKKVVEAAHLENVRVYFSGENLEYWSPLKKNTKYIDPESAFDRIAAGDTSNNGLYPWQKTFMFGIDLTF